MILCVQQLCIMGTMLQLCLYTETEKLEPNVQTELDHIAHATIQLLHTEKGGQQSAAGIRTGESQIGGS